ncbi:MAG: hypothetical protein Q9159_003964 [Coniocarpon cinnabarinum]
MKLRPKTIVYDAILLTFDGGDARKARGMVFTRGSDDVDKRITVGFSVPDVIHIAQAVLHFEPAFEAILPPNRRSNEYARSNWIDNPRLGRAGMSRIASMKSVGRCEIVDKVVSLISPHRYYGFNFMNLRHDLKTIEFRRGDASKTIQDVLMWVELALSFLFASMKVGKMEELLAHPNTIEGLRKFLVDADLPTAKGLHDLSYLDPLFAGREHSSARREPEVVDLENLSPEKQEKLCRKLKQDESEHDLMRARLVAQKYSNGGGDGGGPAGDSERKYTEKEKGRA